jgi:hypothetical protein
VKFAKINHSKSILNRTLVCTVTDATHVKTVNQIAFGSFDTPGIFTLKETGFIPYDHFSYYKAGSRKTGKVFGVGPGRSPAQTLH